MAFTDDIKRAIRRASAPATVGLVAALSFAYVLMWLTKSTALFQALAFFPHTHLLWTVVTYPFASSGAGDAFLCMLLLVWWLWSLGGPVEHDMGTKRYLVFFFASTAIGAIAMFLASILFKSSMPLAGSLIPVAAVTVAWGIANPATQILFMMIIPIPGKWLAVISAGIVLFSFGDLNPAVGVFGLLPLVFAAAVATNRLPFFLYSGALAARKNQHSIENKRARLIEEKVKDRKKEREEKERLRKLFEDSMHDDK